MGKKVTVTDTAGHTTETTVSDDAAAREYEKLPFETEHIDRVDVSDA